MMNSMAKKLLAIAAAVLLVTGLAYGMTINGQLVKAMFENLSSDPTGYLGRVYYNTTSNTVKIYNGTSWTEIGSGSSGGQASNLIENGNAETSSVPAAWTTFDDGAVSTPVDGTGGSPSAITAIARTTTAGELIDQTASFKLVKSAANAQGEGWAYDFSFKTKSQLYSQLVGLEFDFYSSSASADTIVVYVYDKDTATLITPQFMTCGSSSGLTMQTSSCHAKIGWLSTTSDDYRVIFMVSTTSTSAYNYFLDNIYTGQLTAAVGASVGSWQTYTPTGSWTTNTTYSGRKRRVGDSAEYEVSVELSGAPDAVALTINQPSGETIDSSKIANISRGTLGDAVFFDATADRLPGEAAYSSTTSVAIYLMDDAAASTHYMSAATSTVPVAFGTGDRVLVRYIAPIAQWAVAQTFGENNVEYAYNTSVTDANDTTSFGYGPAGTALPGSAFTARRDKTVRFSSTVQSTDTVILEIQPTAGGAFTPITGGFVSQINVSDFQVQNAVTYGVGIKSGSSGTDVIVSFGQYSYPSGATYGAAGNDWSSTTDNGNWRLKKFSSGIPVGFGPAGSTNAGLLKAGTLTKGIVESNSGGVLSSNNIWTASVQVQSGSDCSTANCTLDFNYGGAISDVDQTATGRYTVNFTTSFWSAAPACVISSNRGADSCCDLNGSTTTSSAPVSCTTCNSGVDRNDRFTITCVGPRL